MKITVIKTGRVMHVGYNALFPVLEEAGIIQTAATEPEVDFLQDIKLDYERTLILLAMGPATNSEVSTWLRKIWNLTAEQESLESVSGKTYADGRIHNVLGGLNGRGSVEFKGCVTFDEKGGRHFLTSKGREKVAALPATLLMQK